MPSPAGVLSGLHVVVVDDNVDAREILRRVLGHHGALVTLAASARAALDMLANLVPSVVITDMYLDPGDGREVLRQARTMGVRAPFIAVSTGDFDTQELRRAGFVAFLRKPLDHQTLVDTILTVVRR